MIGLDFLAQAWPDMWSGQAGFGSVGFLAHSRPFFVSGQNFRLEPSHALIGPDWVFFERVSSGLSGRVTRDQVYGACPSIYYRAQFHPKPAQHMNQVSYFRADRVRFVGFRQPWLALARSLSLLVQARFLLQSFFVVWSSFFNFSIFYHFLLIVKDGGHCRRLF